MGTSSKINSDLNKEYRRLLKLIRPKIDHLQNIQDAKLCLLWLAKLADADETEKELRNELLSKLCESVINQNLKYPFSHYPPDGSLGNYVSLEAKLSSSSLSTTNDRSSIRKIAEYHEKAERNKSLIAQHQRYLRELLQSTLSLEKKTQKKLATNSKKEHKKSCHCFHNLSHDVAHIEDGQSSNIFSRVQGEDKMLDKHGKKLDQRFTSKIGLVSENDPQNYSEETSSGPHKKQLEKTTHVLTSIIVEKDKIISKLRSKLDTHLNDSKQMLAQLDETMVKQCENLETKYKELYEQFVNDFFEQKHKQLKKLEELQSTWLHMNSLNIPDNGAND